MPSTDFTRLNQLIAELEQAIDTDLTDRATSKQDFRTLKSELDTALTRLEQLRQKLLTA
jgi:predicted secreted protein